MSMYIECGPVVFLLRDFYDKKPFTTWHWKLDQFKARSVPDKFTEINFNKTTVDISGARTVNCQKDGFYKREIIKADNGTVWRLIKNSTSEVILSFYVDDFNNKISLLEDKTETNGQAAFEFLSRTAVYSMLDSSVLSFHGVLMEYNGKGIIISAPSETGKTTHARLWRDEKKALIINGDNSCCYKEDDSWKGFGIPWSGTSGEQINRSVEIVAAVILERADENKADRINDYDAFCNLHSLIQYPTWDTEKADRAIALCNDFLKDVPVFKLRCKPDTDAVDTLCKALEDLL